MHLWFISIACTANPTKYTEYSSTIENDSGSPEAGDTEIRPEDTGQADTDTDEPPVDTGLMTNHSAWLSELFS